MKRIFAFALCAALFLTLAACGDTPEPAPPAFGLNKTQAELDCGERVTLAVSTELSGKVLWSSDDPEIAGVTEGVVTGYGAGETTITARLGDYSARCAVRVREREKSPDPILALVDETLEAELHSGSVRLRFIRANLPGEADWVSSDPSVASVDAEGNVTPLKVGETVITLSVAGMESRCRVRVTEAPVLILEQPERELYAGDTHKLLYQFKVDGKDGLPELIEWESTDPSVAEVYGGEVTAKAYGTVGISATFAGVTSRVLVKVVIPVRTAADFRGIRNAPRDDSGNIVAEFSLLNDIDFQGEEVPSVAPYGKSAGGTVNLFNGVFEGNGYCLKNFALSSGESNLHSLFGCIGGDGVVRNVNIVGVKSPVSAQYKVIATVAMINLGTIENVYAEVTVSSTEGTNANNRSGGLVIDNRGTLRCCIAEVTVAGGVDPDMVGMLVGKHIRKTALVEHCFALAHYEGDTALKAVATHTVDVPVRNVEVFTSLDEFCENADLDAYDGAIWSFPEHALPKLIIRG